jgi:hypothetical protein
MKHKLYRILFPVSMVFFVFSALQGQNPQYLIGTSSTIAEGDYAPFNTIQPGDTVFIQAGTRSYLRIRDFEGTADHPIVFMNYGGTVSINTTGN